MKVGEQAPQNDLLKNEEKKVLGNTTKKGKKTRRELLKVKCEWEGGAGGGTTEQEKKKNGYTFLFNKRA